MCILILLIIKKWIITKTIPSSHYTPFDYIAAQTTVEHHEEMENVGDEEDDDIRSQFPPQH
ncbi:DUF3951 domain-containing protein [Bacillaceae bacterium SIJ1]|nr:DUF3951 domain-containing protein [Litoribacterium kuwaitense]